MKKKEIAEKIEQLSHEAGRLAWSDESSDDGFTDLNWEAYSNEVIALLKQSMSNLNPKDFGV